LEKFFAQYEHSIDALGAFLTFAAVVISLWVTIQSGKAHRTRLTITGGVRVVVVTEIPKEEWPHYLTLHLTNIGLMRAKVQDYSISWSYPLAKHSLIIRPQDHYGDKWVPSVRYPITIEPNESHSIIVTKLVDFENMFTEEYTGKGIRRLFAPMLTLRLVSADGRAFKVKLDKGTKAIIKRNTRLFGRKKKDAAE
jgi:hypothetical protein